MNSLKRAHKSKTMWLSLILAVASPILEALPQAKAFLGDNYGLALIVLSAIVGGLRYVTTKPLSDK